MASNFNPDPWIPTELALGSDGVVYVGADDSALPPGRAVFVGYALRSREVAAFGVGRLLAWGVIGRLALASDGYVYVHEREIGEHATRKRFCGVATNPEERAALVEELHRTALNLTIAISPPGKRGRTRGKALAGPRGKAPSR